MKGIIVKKEYKVTMCDQCDYLDRFKTGRNGNYTCEKTGKEVSPKSIEGIDFGCYHQIPRWCPYRKKRKEK